jgi:hypothetical protein
MIKEMEFSFVFLIVVGNGELGKDASTTNFEEKWLTKMHKKANIA